MAKDKLIYMGIFLDTHIDSTLEKDTVNQHITLAFKPKEEELDAIMEHLNKEVEI